MKKYLYVLFLLLPTVLKAESPFPDKYCGEQVIKRQGQDFTSDVCVDGKKSRLEMTVEGKKAIVIVRPDKKAVYNIMPSEKLVMVSPIRDEDEATIENYEKNTQRELIGTEMLKGQEHDKYKMKATNQELYLWLNKSNNFPSQIESTDGTIHIEWNKVRLEAPDASLFEIPKGYQVVRTTEEVRVDKP